MNSKEIESKIYSIFSEIASSIGYSPLHGKIIGVLLVKGNPLSLNELAKETGYSTSMVSISLDLLEILGIVKRVKKTGDRKLYIKLSGDLLACLKNALVMKLERGISSVLSDFEEEKKKLGTDKSGLKTINILENEIRRLERYVKLLAGINLP